jgi:MFS family permease
VFSLYMQNILGYSAVQAGAAFLPLTLLIVLIAPIAGKASDRFGSRWLMGTGMTLLSIQLLYFSTLGVHETYWRLLPAMLIGGVGMALVMTPSAAAAMSGVSVAKAGVGSAVLNSARQVGGSVGIALIGAIVAHQVGDQRTPQAFVDGLSTALQVAALIALAGAVLAVTTVRAARRTAAQPVVETAA